MKKENKCPDFPYFGAHYPDATCIDGFLWDLDKYEDGKLYGGGEEPCPFCNTQAFIEQHIDDCQDEPNAVTREDILKWIDKIRERYSKPSQNKLTPKP